jgi:hypothetical protein
VVTLPPVLFVAAPAIFAAFYKKHCAAQTFGKG